MHLSLFSTVKAVYAETTGPITNENLYRRVAREAGASLGKLDERVPVAAATSEGGLSE